MSNKTYNNIISLISFLATLGFIVCKIIGILTASWWFVIVPFLLAAIFHAESDIAELSEEDSDDENDNNLKMA